MRIHDVNRGITRNKKRKRIGRGPGSGHGKTSTRGNKGQGQCSGWTAHPAFEGGRMPHYRRIPKRGFNNKWAKIIAEINVGDLSALFDAGAEITPELLVQHKLIMGVFDQLKVLGDGDVVKKLTVAAHRFSESAKSKIEQAGGTVIVLPVPKRGRSEGQDGEASQL